MSDSTRCRFVWMSPFLGDVQCWHRAGHTDRHEAWRSRRERRNSPSSASWIVVGAEMYGYWLPATNHEIRRQS